MGNTVNKVDPFGDGSGVALYQFEGNANDTGGNYNGTWHGTEQYVAGVLGQAAKFDGNNDIRVTGLVLGDTSTVSLWIMSTKDSNNNRIWSTNNYYIYFATNFLDRWVKNNNLDVFVSSTVMCPNLNQFYHIVIIDNGSAIIGYRNNIAVPNTASSYNTLKNFVIDHFGIGSNTTYSFNGLIDQVRIFNRALTAEEVAILYNEKPSKSFARSNIF